MQFFLLKTVCGLFIGMLIWFALSFLEQVQLCWMMTAAALVAEYFLYIMISAQSVFRLLCYVNIFSYVFTSRIYTDYVNLNFFSYPIGKSTILLWLLFIGTGVLTIVITAMLPKRYPFGNRDLLGRWIHLWNRMKDAVLRRLGMGGFEWYKLLFLTGGGIVLVLGLLLSNDLSLNSGAYNRIEDAVYRQYVAQVQGPVTQSTYDYIARAKASLEDWQIDQAEFEAALNRLEQTVADMPEGIWLIDDTTFLNIFGSKSWRTQRNTAWMALLVLCTVLAFLFSPEQNADLRRMLHCTPRGRERLFWTKYGVAFGVTVLVWLMVFVQEWLNASQMLGETVLNAPCASVRMIRNFPGTVRSYLTVLCVFKGIALLIPMNLCVFIGEKTCNFEKNFLLNGAILLLPAAVYMFGVHGLKIFTPVSFLADGNILLPEADTILIFAFWMAASIATLIAAKRDWVSANC